MLNSEFVLKGHTEKRSYTLKNLTIEDEDGMLLDKDYTAEEVISLFREEKSLILSHFLGRKFRTRLGKVGEVIGCRVREDDRLIFLVDFEEEDMEYTVYPEMVHEWITEPGAWLHRITSDIRKEELQEKEALVKQDELPSQDDGSISLTFKQARKAFCDALNSSGRNASYYWGCYRRFIRSINKQLKCNLPEDFMSSSQREAIEDLKSIGEKDREPNGIRSQADGKPTEGPETHWSEVVNTNSLNNQPGKPENNYENPYTLSTYLEDKPALHKGRYIGFPTERPAPEKKKDTNYVANFLWEIDKMWKKLFSGR